MTRDAAALDQGLQSPHHFRFYAEMLQQQMRFRALKDLLPLLVKRCLTFSEKRPRVNLPTITSSSVMDDRPFGRIFVIFANGV